jgi:hypothetical protein
MMQVRLEVLYGIADELECKWFFWDQIPHHICGVFGEYVPGYTLEDAKRCARKCIADAAALVLLERVAFILLDGASNLFMMLQEFATSLLTALHDYTDSLSSSPREAFAVAGLRMSAEGFVDPSTSRRWRIQKT